MSLNALNRDLAHAVRHHSYETTDDGQVLVPGTGVMLCGEYIHSVNGQDERIDKNLLTTQFLNYLLMVGLHTLPKVGNWYLTLFAGAVVPATNWTAASFPSAASEITSATEGYSETNRAAFNASASSDNQISNLTGGKATFTIKTGSQLVVRGAALLSDQLKGSTAGILASASKFEKERTFLDGDTYELGYRLVLNAA